VALDVLGGGAHERRVLSQEPESGVAARAERVTDLGRGMVVIDSKAFRRTAERASTRDEAVVFAWL
jgi:hypothetical protein